MCIWQTLPYPNIPLISGAMTDDEQTVYQSKLALLSEEHLKEEPSIGKIKKLMKDTFSGRRKWILLDLPQVHNVLEVFPALKKSDRVNTLIFLIY